MSIKKLTMKYLETDATKYSIAQEMKKKGLCKHDMGCYNNMLVEAKRIWRKAKK